MAEREDIVPEGLEVQYADRGYSPAVRVGDLLFVAGVIGVRADGGHDADPATQFSQAFANLGYVLESSGSSFADVVELTSYHVGLRTHLRSFITAKDAAMGGPPHPAWTAVGVAELGLEGILVELRTTAHIPG